MEEGLKNLIANSQKIFEEYRRAKTEKISMDVAISNEINPGMVFKLKRSPYCDCYIIILAKEEYDEDVANSLVIDAMSNSLCDEYFEVMTFSRYHYPEQDFYIDRDCCNFYDQIMSPERLAHEFYGLKQEDITIIKNEIFTSKELEKTLDAAYRDFVKSLFA